MRHDEDLRAGRPTPIYPPRPRDYVLITPQNPNQASSSRAIPAKVESPVLSHSLPNPGTGATNDGSEFVRIDSAVIAALFRLRGSVVNLVDAEKMRLQNDRHAAFAPVTKISSTVDEERERMKHINRKLAEKKESYDLAVAEYEQSRAFLAAAHHDEPEHPLTPGIIDQKKSILKMGETLMNSWYKNVQVARKRVGHWDFKSKEQTTVVMKASKELAAAEALYRQKCEAIDMELEEFTAVALFLNDLAV